MEKRSGRMSEILREAVSKFVARESSGASLITVTAVELRDRDSKALILFTVMPEHKSDAALDFLKRQRSDCRQYLIENTKIARVPFLDFAIDKGELSRQHLDEVFKKIAE